MKNLCLLLLSVFAFQISAQNGPELNSDGITFPNLGSAPNSAEGKVYYDAARKKLKYYNGGSWQNIGEGEVVWKIEDLLDQNSGIAVSEGTPDFITLFIEEDHILNFKVVNGNLIMEPINSSGNTFIGEETGDAITMNGQYNTALGQNAGKGLTDGLRNVLIGGDTGEHIKNTDDNVYIGYKAGNVDSTGIRNTFLGSGAGFNACCGSNNLFLGYRAGALSNGANNIFLGDGAGESVTGDNLLIIPASDGSDFMYGERGNNLLRVHANLQVDQGSLILRNLGDGDNYGLLFGEDINTAFGWMYDGVGTSGENRLHLAEFIDNGRSNLITIKGDGNVGINEEEPVGVLHVNGDAYITGIPTPGGFASDIHVTASGQLIKASSDERLKKDIKTIEQALSKVLKLRGTSYIWKEGPNPNRTLGVIAQEVLEVVPDLVNKDGEYYGVNYSEIPALLIEAIKEQQAIIESFEKKMTRLEDKLTSVMTAQDFPSN